MLTLSNQNAVIIGSGSWGTALALVLAKNFEKVTIISRSQSIATEINEHHTNAQYLPKIKLPENICCTTDITETKEADIILFVVPTAVTKDMATKLATLGIPESTPLISCAKGIELGSGARMSDLISEALPNHPIAVLSGPNHAEEVAVDLATCTVIGSEDPELTEQLQTFFTTPNFRSYRSQDMAGIELGGALKNVFAIAAGIAAGIGLGDNSIAALVTRGLAEMTRLGTALGGQSETFIGLSGVGDLMTTCYSPHSRNNRVGKAIGEGLTLQQACDQLRMVAEGVPNTKSIYEAAQKTNIDTPIISAVYQILYENKSAPDALKDLLNRDPKAE